MSAIKAAWATDSGRPLTTARVARIGRQPELPDADSQASTCAANLARYRQSPLPAIPCERALRIAMVAAFALALAAVGLDVFVWRA